MNLSRIAATVMLTGCILANAEASVTVIANAGRFGDVSKAAVAEKDVNWWDGDSTDDRVCTESFAAAEIAHFLPFCIDAGGSGIALAGVSSSLPASGDVVIVGDRKTNPLIASYPLPAGVALETEQSYSIRSFSEKGRTVVIVEGADREGVLYGAYAFLDALGMRFYGLGEQGTVYPLEKAPIPADLSITGNPSFLTRGFHAWEDRADVDFLLWMARNRMNFWTAADSKLHLCKKLGMKLADGGHVVHVHYMNALYEYPYNHPKFKGDEQKPKDPYKVSRDYRGDADGDGKLSCFEAHPEWFGLKGGVRSDKTKDEFGNNFCTSNPDAVREFAKNIVQGLIDGIYKNVDILNLWLMDGTGRWCECAECAKLGNETDRLMLVVDTVLKELAKARRDGRLTRDVELSSLAYLETVAPPTRPLPKDFDYDHFSITFFPIERCYDHSLADPACTELNRRLAESYLAWTTGEGRYYKGTMFIGEYYNVSYLKSMPMLYTRMMAVDIPWYYRTGTRHFHYMHVPVSLWGTWTLNQYLLGRLLWDAGTDADAVVAEYFRRYYPATGTVTGRFYSDLEHAMTGFKTMRYWGWTPRLKNASAEIFPTLHFKYVETHPLTNDGEDLCEMVEYTKRARNDIDAALLVPCGETEKARLLEDERRFAYGEAMVMFHYHLYRTAMFHHAGDKDAASRECLSLIRYAEILEPIRDLVQVSSSHANAEDGLQATQAVDLYNFFVKTYGPAE